MKKYKDPFKSKLKRLALSILGQGIWLIPLGIAGWYAYTHLPTWCENYFEVAAAQQTAHRLGRKTAWLSNQISWDPSTVAAYLKALFVSTVAAAKANTLASVSKLTVSIGTFILDVLGIIASIYAIIRMKRAYRTKTLVQDMTTSVCQNVLPELEEMREQINLLARQLDQLNRTISEKLSKEEK